MITPPEVNPQTAEPIGLQDAADRAEQTNGSAGAADSVSNADAAVRETPSSASVSPAADAKAPVRPGPTVEVDTPQSASVEIQVGSGADGTRFKIPPAGLLVKPIDPALEMLRSEYENNLRSLVTYGIEAKVGEQWEAQLASYIKLDTQLATMASPQLYRVALLGVAALQTGRTSVASRISNELDFATSTSAALSQVIQGLLFFLTGFVTLAFAIGWSAVVFSRTLGITIAPEISTKLVPVLVATVFGCLGSVVSLLLRLHEFEALKGRSRTFLRLTGLTLPVIGGIFGAVTAALFVSKIVNLSIQEASSGSGFNIFLFIVIGFISGFSERFTRGLLSTAENTLAGRQTEQKTLRVTASDSTTGSGEPGGAPTAEVSTPKPAQPAAKPVEKGQQA